MLFLSELIQIRNYVNERSRNSLIIINRAMSQFYITKCPLYCVNFGACTEEKIVLNRVNINSLEIFVFLLNRRNCLFIHLLIIVVSIYRFF